MGSIQKSFLALKSFNNYILTDVQRNYEHEIAEFSVACMSTHKIKILGTDGQNSIVLFESKKPNGVLITSGWQGDEPAGWEASEELVSLAPECSFIPWISPGCFLNRTHTNNDGRNIDRDWPEAVTKEGFALKNNIELLAKLGNRCCLSLQEDCKRSVGYFYGWETTTNDTILTVGKPKSLALGIEIVYKLLYMRTIINTLYVVFLHKTFSHNLGSNNLFFCQSNP